MYLQYLSNIFCNFYSKYKGRLRKLFEFSVRWETITLTAKKINLYEWKWKHDLCI